MITVTSVEAQNKFGQLLDKAQRGPVMITRHGRPAAFIVEAKNYTSNLSATTEALLADYVAGKQQARLSCQQMADACAADWNAVHETIGPFADRHSTL